jgi:hypothetical protein
MVIAGGSEQAAVPLDTLYAARMIICNGVVHLVIFAAFLFLALVP